MGKILILSLLCLFLAGCEAEQSPATEPVRATAAATVPKAETTSPTVPVPEGTEDLAITSRLESTEAAYRKLQAQLMEDGSLNQADMNELAGQQFTLWDELLNAFWAELTHTLSESQMEQLLQEERAWIRWKEHCVALSANYYDGGSLSILSGNLQAARLTRDRTYELAEILTAKQYPSPSASPDLYRQIFLPLAAAQQTDLEGLQLLLEFRCLSLTEDEGTFEIRDPKHPETYVFGCLTNETDIVTVSQLGYCLNGDLGVRVDLFTVPPSYYTDAFSWDDGTEVSSLEDLTDYLQIP